MVSKGSRITGNVIDFIIQGPPQFPIAHRTPRFHQSPSPIPPHRFLHEQKGDKNLQKNSPKFHPTGNFSLSILFVAFQIKCGVHVHLSCTVISRSLAVNPEGGASTRCISADGGRSTTNNNKSCYLRSRTGRQSRASLNFFASSVRPTVVLRFFGSF